METLKQNVKPRNTNLELFRIISMIMIVAHHYVVNSGLLAIAGDNAFAQNSILAILGGAWGKTGINCFVMITGYFMCKSHITVKKFLKLLLEILFYNIVIYFVFVISGYTSFSFAQFAKSILPVRVVDTGFTSAFIVFFLCIPFINKLIKNISETMHLRLIILCFFLYTFLSTMPLFDVTMNYVSWFIVIYFISSYIRLYPKALFQKTGVWAVLSVISILISSASILVCMRFMPNHIYYFVSDSNKILALTTAICLFMFFKNVKIPYIKFINIIASASFGVLLIHANCDTMRQWLWVDTLKNTEAFNTSWFGIHYLCSVLGVYIICTGIDLLRLYLLEKPFFRFYDKKSPQIYAKLYSFENKLKTKLKID